VYIQHGEVPPDDPNEFAEVFQAADKTLPPRVSPTIYVPTTTKRVTEHSGSATGVSNITNDNSNSNESPAFSDSNRGEISSGGVSEDGDSYTSSGNKISESNEVGLIENDISKPDLRKDGKPLFNDSTDKDEQNKGKIIPVAPSEANK
jgi:hypothetical protein